jgi:hypothetical protein
MTGYLEKNEKGKQELQNAGGFLQKIMDVCLKYQRGRIKFDIARLLFILHSYCIADSGTDGRFLVHSFSQSAFIGPVS